MNFNFVDVSRIDAQEPIFPKSDNWESVAYYPFNAIDSAFLVETTIERFYEGGRIPEEFTPGVDDVATKTLFVQPLLRCANAMSTRGVLEGETKTGTPLFIPQKPYVDKEGESLPSYNELLEFIEVKGVQNRFTSGNPPQTEDLRNLYTDIRKFKRKNIYFNLDTSHLEYVHTNPFTPAPETGAYAWRFDQINEGSTSQDEMTMRPTDQFGLFLLPRNVASASQFKDVKILIDYTLWRWATNQSGTSYIMQESSYKSEWLDSSIVQDTTVGLIARIPQAYYSRSRCLELIQHFWPGWDVPKAYSYTVGSDTYKSRLTYCGVDISVRFLFGDLDLKTDF